MPFGVRLGFFPLFLALGFSQKSKQPLLATVHRLTPRRATPLLFKSSTGSRLHAQLFHSSIFIISKANREIILLFSVFWFFITSFINQVNSFSVSFNMQLAAKFCHHYFSFTFCFWCFKVKLFLFKCVKQILSNSYEVYKTLKSFIDPLFAVRMFCLMSSELV